MNRPHRSQRPHTAESGRTGAGLPEPQDCILTVESVGARGDGLARTERGLVYVPFSLAGERLQARVLGDRAEIAHLLEESPERIRPPCAVFGRCGGCQLQHWAEGPYLDWKHALVVEALAKRGIHAAVEPITAVWGEGRRRAGLHAVRSGRELRFGFVQRGGGGVEPIGACPLLAPPLEAALPALKRLAGQIAPDRGELVLQCLLTPAGLDVDVKGAGRVEAHRARLPQLIQAALEADLARLSFEGEPLIAPRTPRLQIGLATVEPPPGAFVQPTLAGEAALAARVLDAAQGGRRFADLFCGMGAFALRLAALGEVLAVEGDGAMLAALQRAADGASGQLHAVSTLHRDLLRSPLAALELKRVDTVVIDPPRSGARLQAEQIVASRVERVISVSCDPASFARDARALLDGGFRLGRVTPFDQFRWSAHVELVADFAR